MKTVSETVAEFLHKMNAPSVDLNVSQELYRCGRALVSELVEALESINLTEHQTVHALRFVFKFRTPKYEDRLFAILIKCSSSSSDGVRSEAAMRLMILASLARQYTKGPMGLVSPQSCAPHLQRVLDHGATSLELSAQIHHFLRSARFVGSSRIALTSAEAQLCLRTNENGWCRIDLRTRESKHFLGASTEYDALLAFLNALREKLPAEASDEDALVFSESFFSLSAFDVDGLRRLVFRQVETNESFSVDLPMSVSNSWHRQLTEHMDLRLRKQGGD